MPAGDAPNHYFTIEFRDPSLGYASGTAWGQNLPGPGVVIHEVKTNGLSYLVDQQGGPNFQTCGAFQAASTTSTPDPVLVTVTALPSPWVGDEAWVHITTQSNPGPSACGAGGGSVTGAGGSGGPAENCQYPNCGPRPPQCMFPNGADNPVCGVHIGRMQ